MVNPCKTAANTYNAAIRPLNAGSRAIGHGLAAMVRAMAAITRPLMERVERGIAKIKAGVTRIVDDLLAIFAAVQEVFDLLNEIVGGNILGILKMMIIVRIQALLPGISMVEGVLYATIILVTVCMGIYCSPCVSCCVFCGPLADAFVFDTDDWDDEFMPPDGPQIASLLCLGCFAALVACMQTLSILPPAPKLRIRGPSFNLRREDYPELFKR